MWFRDRQCTGQAQPQRKRVDSGYQGLGRFEGVAAPRPGFLSGVVTMLWSEMVVTPVDTKNPRVIQCKRVPCVVCIARGAGTEALL